MNITRIEDSTKILQKTRSSISTFGGGSTSGKYVYINSSLTKNSQNNYTVNISLSCSSGQVYNGYGINVYAVIGGTSHYLGSPTISSGSFSTNNFAKAFSVGSNISVYARCICAACESGQHSTDRSKFENSTSADTAVYVNPTIIPSAPNPTMSWGRGNTITSTYGDTVYSGGISSNDGSQNYTNFNCGMPGNAVSVTLSLDRYVNGGWQNVANGYPSFRKNWTNEDRGFSFRLRSWSTSSTGHTTSAASFPQWRINDLPSIDGSRISFNAPRTTDNITLSWPVLSDGLNSSNANWYRIHLQKLVNGSYSDFRSFNVSNVTSANFNLSSYGFNNGDRCRAQIEPGDALEWSHSREGGAYIVRNSAPYFSAGTIVNSGSDSVTYNKVFKDSIYLAWNAALDSQGDSLTYSVYYKKIVNGAWSDLIELNTISDKSITVNCINIAEKGDKVQFFVRANDGLESSGFINSHELIRATNPAAPGIVSVNPNTTDEHFESISSVSWSNVIEAIGYNCSNYKIDMLVYKNKTDSIPYSVSTINSASISTNYFNIDSITRGYYFLFKVKAIDIFGLESLQTSSRLCRKNRMPNAPVNFKVNSSRVNVYSSVPLIWDASTDPDGDNVTYSIFYSLNRGSYSLIANSLTSTTYSHNISSAVAGGKLGYKIISIDKFGVSSNETLIENNHNIVVNTKPNPPTLLYPTSMVFDSTPRIIFRTGEDINNDPVNIKITLNGIVYNSATSSNFDKSSYDSRGENIVFIPNNLNNGINIISIKEYDGYQDSDSSEYQVEYSVPLLNKINETSDILITPIIYNNFVRMITLSRKAYGLSEMQLGTITSGETFVLALTFNDLYENANQVTSQINSTYPGKNRIKTKPIIARSNLISKKIYNSILEIITNI